MFAAHTKAIRPARVHCSTVPAKVHPSLITAAVQTTAWQQPCFTVSLLVRVCCSHKGTMTSNSGLQHRSCQSASLTNQSCCADNSLTAGMFHCKFTCESLLLTQRHYDQQECTAAQIMPKCIPHFQSCCADNSLTAGMFHCKFTCEVCCSHKGTMTSNSAL